MKKNQPSGEAAEKNGVADAPPIPEEKAGHVIAPPVPAPADPTFTIDQLRPDARTLFGVSQSTYDGATHGLTGEYTVAAMKEHINKWLKEVY